MNKKSGVARSLVICLAVLVLMVGAGYILFSGENEASFVSSKVEAAFENVNGEPEAEKKDHKAEEAGEKKDEKEEKEDIKEEPEEIEEEKEQSDDQGEETASGEASSGTTDKEATSGETEAPVDHQQEQAPVEKQAESIPAGSDNEEPATEPEVLENAEEDEPEPEPDPEPEAVSYSWGASSSHVFRMEVAVSNNGSNTANDVTVSVPLLENRSPYQETSLRAVNYEVVSNSGRVSTFKLGDINPGETKTIVADFDITIRSVSINSSNETIEKARRVYEQYAGSGNCRQLARGFINKSRELGIEAREVIGFARPERGPMTAGSLQGTRHSWAEFYVEGLGWVPVDLTFQYFGELPKPSHVVESYSDESISISYSGGNLSATWSNAIR